MAQLVEQGRVGAGRLLPDHRDPGQHPGQSAGEQRLGPTVHHGHQLADVLVLDVAIEQPALVRADDRVADVPDQVGHHVHVDAHHGRP